MTHVSVASSGAALRAPLLVQPAGAPAAYIESFSPAMEACSPRCTHTSNQYEQTLQRAIGAARAWLRCRPRSAGTGAAVCRELRRHKRELAQLIALENGKIIAEALGEVQK